MIEKFNVKKENKILLCVVNNLDKYQSGWAREISINITDFMLGRFTTRNYDVYISTSEDEMLLEASKEYYTHAVVIAMGTSLGLSDRIFPAIEELCKQDFFIAGHVLHRNEESYYKNAYYELHHQFYVVNLKDYAEIGCPVIGQPADEKHTQIEPLRSQECLYNDHEVAAWIKQGTAKREYAMKLHGWNIISTGLQHNKTFIDLGSNIRDNKQYLYYEYDHVFLRQLSDMHHNQFFCNTFYASWNSDAFKESIPFEGPVEQYITVGIGVYWITYLERLGVTDNTRVVFTDINYNCLQFMKAMVEEWDGTNYAEFYKKHVPLLPSGTHRDVDAYIEYTRKEWELFIADRPNWLETWNRIRKLKFDYVLIDYMGSYDLTWIEQGKRTLLNLSDVFTHSPYIFGQTLKYRIHAENRLFNSLCSRDPAIHVMMTARAADGFAVSDRYDGAASDFKLTDINAMTRPSWHSIDWQSPKMLG